MTVLVLAASLATACGPAAVTDSAGATSAPAPAASATPTAAADGGTVTCDAVEHPPQQAGSHLLGDQEPPVAYSSTPPTSGWHSSGAFDVAVQAPDDPLTEPEQVSVLEAGGVVVTYGSLPDDAIDELAEKVRDRYDGRVAVTPYDELDNGEVAFAAWTTLQRCDGVDLAALDQFVAEFGPDESVEPGHAH